MIIDVNKIDSLGRSFEFALTDEDLDLGAFGVRLAGPAIASVTVRQSGNTYNVAGTVSGEQSIDCTRCLAPVSIDLRIEIEADFVKKGHFATDGDGELLPHDLDADELLDDTLDLKHLVREQILLAFPEQLFCRPDCKGLCEKCGGNLNLVDCKCNEEEIDPRWAALKDLT